MTGLVESGLKDVSLRPEITAVLKQLALTEASRYNWEILFEWLLVKASRHVNETEDLSGFKWLFSLHICLENCGLKSLKCNDFPYFFLMNFYYALRNTKYRFGMGQGDFQIVEEIKDQILDMIERSKTDNVDLYKFQCAICTLIAVVIPNFEKDRLFYLRLFDCFTANNLIRGLQQYHSGLLLVQKTLLDKNKFGHFQEAFTYFFEYIYISEVSRFQHLLDAVYGK